MKALFYPDSVAVVGASRNPRKIGYQVLRSLVEYGYQGRVYAVNPAAESILGVRCYRSISEIPDSIDLAVLIVKAEDAPKAVRGCVDKGAKGIIIVSGGFKERGEEGEKLEREIVQVARSYNARVIGPNCIGIYNSSNRLDTLFQAAERCLRPDKGPLAFISQSGTFSLAMLEWAAECGLGVSKFVSLGNRCDLTEAELLEYLAEDPDTQVIAMYIESIPDGRKLLSAIRRTAEKKPVVVLLVGRTEEGAIGAKFHTGRLAGDYRRAAGALRQAGAIIADTIYQLFDYAKALAWQPLPQGNRVAFVTNGAGPVVTALDRLSEWGLRLADLDAATIQRLRDELPAYTQAEQNPVDLTGSATSSDFKTALSILLESKAVDIIMPFFVFQDTPLDEGIASVMAEVSSRSKEAGKPVVCCAMGGPYTRSMVSKVEESRIPVYESPERALSAAWSLYMYSAVRKRLRSGAT